MNNRCIVFDLDGTIYFGNRPAYKANEVIHKAKEVFEHVFFVTNNSAKTREELIEKLKSMDVDVSLDELINSGFAVAKYLAENGYNNVHCIGSDSFKTEIKSFGINIDTVEPKAVVVGYDPDFSLKDLTGILNSKLDDFKLIIANRERNYPGKDGIIMPGAGPIVSAVENALNKKTDVIVGKPNPLMLELITEGLNLKPQDICVVGDSYESDVMMAEAYGSSSVLIDKSKLHNCFTVEKLADLLELF